METITIISSCLFSLFILILISDIFDSLNVLYFFSILNLLVVSFSNNLYFPKLLNVTINPVLVLLVSLSILSNLFKKSNLLVYLVSYFNKLQYKFQFIIYLLGISCIASSFLNNALIVSSIIPLIIEICQKNNWEIQQFLMPLSFASMLGGTITTIGSSTNLVAVSLLLPELKIGILDLAKYSIITAFIGILYLLLAYRYLYSNHTIPTCFKQHSISQNMSIRLIFVKVGENSDAIGLSIKDAKLQELFGLQLCGIQRGDTFSALPPRSFTIIEKNDILTLIGWCPNNIYPDDKDEVSNNLIANSRNLHLLDRECLAKITQPNIAIGLIPKYLSSINNKKCKDIGFKLNYHSVLLGIVRNKQIINRELGEQVIKSNDFLIIHGLNSNEDMQSKLSKICTKITCLSGTSDLTKSTDLNSKWTDLLILVIFITIISSGFIEIADASLISLFWIVILLGLRIINNQDIPKALKNYKSILLGTSSSLLLTATLKQAGVILIISSITKYIDTYHTWTIYFIYHILSSSLSILLSNVAVVSILIPVVKISYLNSNLLFPISLCIIHGASCCFASPTGYHTNLMIHNIGNYSCRDYLKLGLPLHLITSVVFSTALYLMY